MLCTVTKNISKVKVKHCTKNIDGYERKRIINYTKNFLYLPSDHNNF